MLQKPNEYSLFQPNSKYFWNGFRMVAEYPDVKIFLNISDAKEYFKKFIHRFPVSHIQLIENYGMENQKIVMEYE